MLAELRDLRERQILISRFPSIRRTFEDFLKVGAARDTSRFLTRRESFSVNGEEFTLSVGTTKSIREVALSPIRITVTDADGNRVEETVPTLSQMKMKVPSAQYEAIAPLLDIEQVLISIINRKILVSKS